MSRDHLRSLGDMSKKATIKQTKMNNTGFLKDFLSKPHINRLFDNFEKQDFSKKRNVNNLPCWVLNTFVSDERQKEYVKYHMGINNSDKYFILTYFEQLKNLKKMNTLYALKELPTEIIRVIYETVNAPTKISYRHPLLI